MMDFTCILSTVLFVVSNLLGFSYFHRYRSTFHSSHEERESYYLNMTALEPEFIKDHWEHRIDNYFFELSSGILNAMAWMVFCLPILQVAWLQSRRGTHLISVHVAIGALALGGSITELISRLMFIGATSTGNWLAKDFNLSSWTGEGTTDDIGWRVLEMITIVTRGFLLWIDAAEWLFLSAIFTLLYVSTFSAGVFSRGWARLGMLIALLAFVDFSSEVLRLKSWMTFSLVAVLISWVSRLLLMPIWLLWLGRQLVRVRAEATAKRADDSLALAESEIAAEGQLS